MVSENVSRTFFLFVWKVLQLHQHKWCVCMSNLGTQHNLKIANGLGSR